MNSERIGDVAATLLEYFESNTTFQGGGIVTVPAQKYTDPSEARSEIELIFKRLPLMLALSCEMPKPGDYKAMEVAGLPILISRDKAGISRAFLNVCAHRWAPVVAEGLGTCPHLRFVCPFHGWTYGVDGRLIGIPDDAKFGRVDKTAHGLKELPCKERYGMIFVCLTAGAPLDLDGYYGALLEEYADFDFQNWSFLGSSVLGVANWKLTMTNFFESYHFAKQHPKTVSLRWIPNLSHYEGFGPHMRIGFAEHSIAKLRDVPRDLWGKEEGRGFTFMRYFFPNVTGSIYPSDISVFMQVFPGSTPGTSRVVVLYIRKDQPKDDSGRQELEGKLEDVMKMSDEVLRDEDFATCIATQKGLESGAHEGLIYGRNERGPQYFHEWVNWYLQDNSTLRKPAL